MASSTGSGAHASASVASGGRHDERVAVVRPEVEHLARGDQVHVLLLATEGADREAAADRLGQRDEVRLDAEVARRAAVARR